MHNLHWLQKIDNCPNCSSPVTRKLIDGSKLCANCNNSEDSPKRLSRDVKLSILSLTLVLKVLQALEEQIDKLS